MISGAHSILNALSIFYDFFLQNLITITLFIVNLISGKSKKKNPNNSFFQPELWEKKIGVNENRKDLYQRAYRVMKRLLPKNFGIFYKVLIWQYISLGCFTPKDFNTLIKISLGVVVWWWKNQVINDVGCLFHVECCVNILYFPAQSLKYEVKILVLYSTPPDKITIFFPTLILVHQKSSLL